MRAIFDYLAYRKLERRLRRARKRSVVLRRERSLADLEEALLDAVSDPRLCLPSWFTAAFVGGIRDVAAAHSRHETVSDVLTDAVDELQQEAIRSHVFFALRRFAMNHGLFGVGLSLRQAGVDRAILECTRKDAGTPELIRGIRVAVDQGDFVLALRLRRGLGRGRAWLLNRWRPDVATLDTYLRSVGVPSSSQHGIAGEFLEPESWWTALVRGRSVALVGPAAVEAAHGAEIDDHDLVARMNYRRDRSPPPATAAGTRVDISYYVDETELQVGADVDESGLSAAVFKTSDGVPQGCRVGRVALTPHRAFIVGKPNLGPIALFDLVTAGARVKVFNMNFYVSTKPYFSGYGSHRATDTRLGQDVRFGDEGTLSYCSSLSNHDPLSQINFVRNLARGRSVVAVDRTCGSVLAMSDAEIMDSLDAMYGSLGR